MAMEMFIRKQATSYAAVTVRRNGSIHVSEKAIEEFHLEGKRSFTLHLDEEAGQIGIKPVDDDKDPSTFKASKEKGMGIVIGCQAFLKAARIPYWQGSKVLKADWHEQTGMIILKIG